MTNPVKPYVQPIFRLTMGMRFLFNTCCAVALAATANLFAAAPVLTRSYDDSRSGATTSETVLAPATVAAGLRILYTLKIPDDPRIEAQPLYVPDLKMNDGTNHDVIFVCSMTNTIWAFDANTGAAIWKNPVALGPAYASPPGSQDLNVNYGILSTPVIDLDSLTMYVVNWISDKATRTKRTFQIHALRLSDGKPRPTKKAPLSISASVTNAVGQVVSLSQVQKQRSALLLTPLRDSVPPVHKILYIAVTGAEDPPDENNASKVNHGWVVAIDVNEWQQKAAWVSTPRTFGGGIWQGGQGPAADDHSNVYLMTGNGGYLKGTAGKLTDFSGTTDFPEAFVKLKYSDDPAHGAALTLLDWFIPFRDALRSSLRGYDYRDQDLGSAGPLVPPGTDLLLGAGKDGVLYVMDRNNLGKVVEDCSKLKAPPIYFTYFPGFNIPASEVTNLDFAITNGYKTHHLHHSPVYWNSPDNGPMLFDWGENECLRAWTLNTSTGVAGFVAKSAEVASADLASSTNSGIGGMTGGILTLSANGNRPHSGVIWATAPITGDANKNICPGIVRAYDATALDSAKNADGTQRLKLLWSSTDQFSFDKFCPPVVANGKLLVSTYDGRVIVYGPK
jgi:outer membrane protein assembly factor BamB